MLRAVVIHRSEGLDIHLPIPMSTWIAHVPTIHVEKQDRKVGKQYGVEKECRTVGEQLQVLPLEIAAGTESVRCALI